MWLNRLVFWTLKLQKWHFLSAHFNSRKWLAKPLPFALLANTHGSGSVVVLVVIVFVVFVVVFVVVLVLAVVVLAVVSSFKKPPPAPGFFDPLSIGWSAWSVTSGWRWPRMNSRCCWHVPMAASLGKITLPLKWWNGGKLLERFCLRKVGKPKTIPHTLR